MEKHSRNRRTAECCRSLNLSGPARILAVCLFFLCASVCPEASEIDVDVSAWEIGIDEPLVVAVMIRNELPPDTDLFIVSVPDAFSPVSSKKELSVIPFPGVTPATTVSATVFTLEWVARASGVHEVGPFRVTVRGSTIELPSVYITVREALGGYRAVLVWNLPPVIPESGKPLTLSLAGSFSGEAVSLRCPPPENSLLSVAKGQTDIPADNGFRILAIYEWTPLSDGMLALPVALLEYRSSDGEIRYASTKPRSVQVVRGKKTPEAVPKSSHVQSAFSSADPQEAAPASNTASNAAAVSVGDAEVSALLQLRRMEYSSLFPGAARAERMRLEESVGLRDTLPVPRGGWKIPAVLAALGFCMAGLLLGVVSRSGRRFNRASAVCLAMSVLCASLTVYLFASDTRTLAVVDACALLHVPEPGSTVIDSLPGGTAVFVIDSSGGWSCVEAPSGREGWVPSKVLHIISGER